MNLIYSMAYGSTPWHQCCMMVDSMRRLGGFTGDIKVYSDTRAEMGGAEVVYYPEGLDNWSIMGARWELGRSMDLSRYNKVAMIDSDVICIAPVRELFNFCYDGVYVAEEFPDGRHVSGHSPWTFSDIPFPEGVPVFNCGTVFGSASVWKQFSALMCELMLEMRPRTPWPYQWIDQQALNHISVHNLFGVSQLPDNWVSLFRSGHGVAPHTKLLHVLPFEKERVMRVVYSLASGDHLNRKNLEDYQ